MFLTLIKKIASVVLVEGESGTVEPILTKHKVIDFVISKEK